MAVERTDVDWAEQAEAQAILEAAAQDNTPLMWMLRPNPHVIPLLFAALGLTAMVALAFPIFGITQGLRSVSWGFFWAGLLAGLPLLFISLAAVWGASLPTDRSSVAIWMLRDAAALGDAELVPMAEPQPEPPTAVETPGSFRPVWGIRWVDNRRSSRFRYAWLCVFWLGVSVNVLLLPLSILWPALHDLSSLFGNLAPLIFFLPTAIATIIQSRGAQVIADAVGLRWRHGFRGRKEERISWGEVRSLMRVMVRNDSTFRPQPFYLLDTGAHILRWGPAASQSRIARTPPEDFLRLVSGHTRLPLRDATALAYTIQRTLRGALEPLVSGALAVPPGSPTIRIPGLALALRPTTSQRERARLLKRLAWTPLLLFGLLYAAGILLALIQYIRIYHGG
jgi:hypothetical protein